MTPGTTSFWTLTPRALCRVLAVLALCAGLVPALAPALARAQDAGPTRVQITQGVMEPIPVAIPDFAADDPAHADMAARIVRVITDDLASSGLIAPVDPDAFIQSPASLAADGPRFAEWRTVGAQALLTGRVGPGPDGGWRAEFRLWDTLGERQLAGKAYTATPDNWRRVAHIMADAIYERLTGETGYFDTRILYVAESGPPTARVKRLAIMDQDGANAQTLTSGRALVLTPRFAPNQQTVAYMSYEGGAPRVYLYDLNTGGRELLGSFPGMTFAPRFAPDGRTVIMSMSQGGNSDIYAMDLATRTPRRLTAHPGIDTAPSFSPDGRQVVFESDRGGTQQLYVMDARGEVAGGAARRITFGKGRYANPVWSPRGDLIAFTRMHAGQFYIGVIRPDGSGERLIAQAYHVEGPTWAPGGRRLAYFKEVPTGPGGRGRRTQVYTIDITGYGERALPTPTDASDPAWSPPGSRR